MPSDNLEKYFKEKIEAVQHTPPPNVNWQPEAAWQQLQQIRPNQVQRPARPGWLFYAAAAWAIILISGLTWWFVSEQGITSTKVAVSRPATIKPLPNLATTNQAITKTNILPPAAVMPQPTINSLVKLAPSKAAPEKKLAILPPKKQLPAAPDFTAQSVPTATVGQAEKSLENNLVLNEAYSGTEKANIPKPLKITVVLGAPTLARTQPSINLKSVAETKKKIRLRIYSPNSQPTDELPMATARATTSALPLGAHIEL